MRPPGPGTSTVPCPAHSLQLSLNTCFALNTFSEHIAFKIAICVSGVCAAHQMFGSSLISGSTCCCCWANCCCCCCNALPLPLFPLPPAPCPDASPLGKRGRGFEPSRSQLPFP